VSALAQTITQERSIGSSRAIDVALVVAGALLMGGLANVSVQLPFTPVPVTGQTLGVLLVGGALGSLLGGVSMLLYLALGAIGLPFYANGDSGLEYLGFGTPSAGYLWGFVVAAVLIGRLAEKRWDRGVGSAIGAFLLGEIVIFTIGIAWLSRSLDISGEKAIELGLYPFVVGDVLKVLLAAGAFPLLWRLLQRDR
jgi:biotin transport system substrate-specific component